MFKNISHVSKVLTVFCATEMWERYGFYVIQALLALYLSLHLHLSDEITYDLVGSFTALTYISPIIGGWLADNFLGQKKAVLMGALLLSLSYILISFVTSLDLLLSVLALVATGTGLLKPSVSALLGRQYSKHDPKRNSGFTIFYLGITTGIILGTVLPIQLQQVFGWKVCFLSAALGAAFSFFVFFYGTRKFHIQECVVFEHHMLRNWCIALSILALCFTVFYVVLHNTDIGNLFFLGVVALSLGLVLGIAKKEKGSQRYKTLSLMFLIIIAAFFWAFYFEMFLVLTLFITRVVEPTILGIDFPAPYYVSVQSVGMIVFGLFLSKLWARMHYKNVAFVTSIKFTLAIFFMLLAYLLILFLISTNKSSELIVAWPVLFAYLAISVAELLLSPIGLSVVTQLSSEKVVSTMMGIFFVSLGVGAFLSGKLAEFAVIDNQTESLILMKAQYLSGFKVLVMILLGGLVLTCLFSFIIKQLSKRILRYDTLADQEALLGQVEEGATLIH